MLRGKWRNITDIPEHKLLQYRQTEQRLNSGLTTRFYQKTLSLQNFIYAVKIVVAMCFPYDLQSLYKTI